MEDRVIIGDKIEFEKDMESVFTLSFIPLDIFDNWTRASSLSDFIAEYFGSYFGNESSHNLISTVINEFIENAVKFTKNNSQPIVVIVKKRDNDLICRITNSIPKHRKTAFIEICKELFSEDLDQLFLDKIIEGSNNKTESGIGLILVKKDYHVKTNFDFFKDNNDMNNVNVTFKLNLQ